MSGFVIVALDKNNSSIYVSNTSPILWTDMLDNAKVFFSYQHAKNELEDNFISLSVTVYYTDICCIFISEYVDGVEIARERYL